MCGCTIHVYKKKWTKQMVNGLKSRSDDMTRWVEDNILVLAARTPRSEEATVHEVRELLESYREALIDQFLLTIIEEYEDDVEWVEDIRKEDV